MSVPSSRTLFRIVASNPPSIADFTSNASHGRTLQNPTPERRRRWAGLSMFATEAQARRNARKFPRLGAFIATVTIPDDALVRIERTSGPGHYTVWGHPAYLLERVTDVTKV
jgi:hypothetical protein